MITTSTIAARYVDAESVATVVALVDETAVSDSDATPGRLVNDAPEPENTAAVNVPEFGLYDNPVSVSAPCVPVAPSTNNGYTVSSVELLAVTVTLVASVAVAEFPVQEPDEPDALPVTLPAKAPVNVVAVRFPSDGLYVNPLSV